MYATVVRAYKPSPGGEAVYAVHDDVVYLYNGGMSLGDPVYRVNGDTIEKFSYGGHGESVYRIEDGHIVNYYGDRMGVYTIDGDTIREYRGGSKYGQAIYTLTTDAIPQLSWSSSGAASSRGSSDYEFYKRQKAREQAELAEKKKRRKRRPYTWGFGLLGLLIGSFLYAALLSLHLLLPTSESIMMDSVASMLGLVLVIGGFVAGRKFGAKKFESKCSSKGQ